LTIQTWTNIGMTTLWNEENLVPIADELEEMSWFERTEALESR
jgi:hypothetical protein